MDFFPCKESSGNSIATFNVASCLACRTKSKATEYGGFVTTFGTVYSCVRAHNSPGSLSSSTYRDVMLTLRTSASLATRRLRRVDHMRDAARKG